jgi:hypothetical protein
LHKEKPNQDRKLSETEDESLFWSVALNEFLTSFAILKFFPDIFQNPQYLSKITLKTNGILKDLSNQSEHTASTVFKGNIRKKLMALNEFRLPY